MLYAVEQLSPCTAATEPAGPRACAPQQEKPPQWEAFAPRLECSSCTLQLEKAHTQQWRPSTAKSEKKKNLVWLLIQLPPLPPSWAGAPIWPAGLCIQYSAVSILWPPSRGLLFPALPARPGCGPQSPGNDGTPPPLQSVQQLRRTSFKSVTSSTDWNLACLYFTPGNINTLGLEYLIESVINWIWGKIIFLDAGESNLPLKEVAYEIQPSSLQAVVFGFRTHSSTAPWWLSDVMFMYLS